MGKLYDSFKSYFENTPEEVIDRDWQELEYLNEIGPDVIEYAQKFYGYISSLEPYYSDILDIVESCEVEINNNLEPYSINTSTALERISYSSQIEIGISKYCLAA